ncbi:hypothetical protein V8C42DRAFT_328394 [Trichoderma barbatum]
MYRNILRSRQGKTRARIILTCLALFRPALQLLHCHHDTRVRMVKCPQYEPVIRAASLWEPDNMRRTDTDGHFGGVAGLRHSRVPLPDRCP